MNNKIASSSELQVIVLSTVIKDVNILAGVCNYINESFFDKYSYKLIYKSIVMYYNTYSKLPTIEELMVSISESYDSNFIDLESLRAEVNLLYSTPSYEEKFVIDKITSFIRRSNTEKVLKDLIPKLQSTSESIPIDYIGEELEKGLNFSLCKTTSFNLADTDRIAEVRVKAIGTDSNPLVIKSCIPGINSSLQFKGYKPGDLVMIVSPPGVGKTMFMVNEGSNASQQGYKVLHVFLGDMEEYDGLIRYSSNYTKMLQNDIVDMSPEEQQNLIKQYNYQGFFSNITVTVHGPSEITVSEMIQEIDKLQIKNKCHYDLICVDYADNLIPESTMMYESGGDIYNKLSLLAKNNRSVVIVGSQPNKSYWSQELIPLEGVAESSKKQHVIDVMLTMGMTSKGSTVGSIFVPKVRRGDSGKIIRVRTYFERAKLEQISDKDYANYLGGSE